MTEATRTAQAQRVEALRKEAAFEQRLAARLDESVTGDPSEFFTTHEVSPERREASLERARSSAGLLPRHER